MKIKNIMFVLFCSLLLSACGVKKKNPDATDISAGTKILVNELALDEKPFTVLVPHSTNRLFTFVAINANKAKTATIDIEYQSGDLLKGARSTLETPIINPYMKAIILGSCSTGGKCSFDKDLKSGTQKFKLSFDDKKETHVLKGDFAFVNGQNNLPDGKVIFSPSKSTIKDNLILLNSFGLPKPFDKEIVLYPIVISAVSEKNVVGTLTINQSGVTGISVFDGQIYTPLSYTEKDGSITISINNKPWSMKAEIVRDDEKGSKESLSLYLLGPIVLHK